MIVLCVLQDFENTFRRFEGQWQQQFWEKSGFLIKHNKSNKKLPSVKVSDLHIVGGEDQNTYWYNETV